MTKILLALALTCVAACDSPRQELLAACAAESDEVTCSCEVLEDGYCDLWPDGVVVCRGTVWPERDSIQCD